MKLSSFYSHKYIYLTIAIGLFILMIIGSFLFSLQSKQNTSDNQATQLNQKAYFFPSPTNNNVTKPIQKANSLPAFTFPNISVKEWVLSNKPPAYLPAAANIYSLKENYSIDEAKLFISKWFKPISFETQPYTLIAKNAAGDKLIFSLDTGAFLYTPKNGVSLNKTLDAYIQTLPIYDSTLKVIANYKKKSTPGITYYEIHRDWQRIGFPIFNSIGLLNHSETQQWSTESFATRPSNSPKDSDIYQSLDKKDGLSRFNIFNTITIGVNDSNKKVVSVQSTVRPFQNQKPNSKELITYDEAVQKLKNNQYTFLRSFPSGTGNTNLAKVYAQGQTVTDRAIVVESIIAYLENPLPEIQQSLEPYYLFRGSATLKSGYRINFYAGVPASSNQLTLSPFFLDSILRPVFAATPIPIPTFFPQFTSFPQLNTQQQAFYRISQPTINKMQPCSDPSSGNQYLCLTQPVNNIPPGVYTQPAPSGREACRIAAQATGTDLSECGNNDFIDEFSPSIFVYSEENTLFTIIPKTSLTYVDPQLNTEDSWNVVMKTDNEMSVNNVTRDFLYYEYKPVLFNRPTTGWVIQKKELGSFSQKISLQLGLTQKESERLYFELYFSAQSVNADNVFIALVSQNEVDKKLPLVIQPQIEHVLRFHFYVGKTNSLEKVREPVLSSITRYQPMLVELGSAIGE